MLTEGCASARLLFFSKVDFGATPRDEIHLLCLLIKDRPMKLTSGYCFTCVFFFLGPLNNERKPELTGAY